ncbi:MAG: hypothetical protein HONDAALG_02584 [Gammaproteobacteria bacterium]|nr:hypothetical protein [Gammaproteobacteria bacterium]
MAPVIKSEGKGVSLAVEIEFASDKKCYVLTLGSLTPVVSY